MVKKHMVALYVQPASAWVRICKSTAFDLALNPQTNDYDYIADEVPTTELDRYAPSLQQALTMYKGEPDFEAVKDRFYNLSVGSEAKLPVLIVYRYEPLDDDDPKVATVFLAQEAPNASMVITNYNSVDSTLTFDLHFNGGIKKGYAEYEGGVPSFTEGEYPST
jgi:hypothetical protein